MKNIMRIGFLAIKNQKSKIKNCLLFCLAIAFTLASCKLEEPDTIQITKPLSVADIEFLNAYNLLKTYVDRAANPNFSLSAQTSISDVTDKGLIYRLLASNFDQITPDGMLHGNIVEANGAYNFGNIPSFLPVASDAGISIFGQALVWHAEQRGEYLNGEIAPETKTEMVWIPGSGGYGEMLVNGDFANDDWDKSFKANGSAEGALTANGQGPGGQGRALKITNPAVQADGWRSQMVIVWDTPMLEGEEWTFKMDYKSDEACEYGNQAQGPIYSYKHSDIIPKVLSTTAWQTLETTFVVEERSDNCTAIAFDLGLTATTYYFANVSLYKHAVIEEIEELVNGDFEDDDWEESFKANGSAEGALTANGQGAGGQGRALAITNPDVQSDGWKSQMIVVWDTPMLEGEEWIFEMDYKSDVACEFGNQAQGPIYSYMHSDIIPKVSSTTSWQTLKTTIVVEQRSENCSAIAFDLGLTATTYYFDNISLIKVQVGGSSGKWEEVTLEEVPKTDEEKTVIITAQLEKWIAEIMDVAGDFIKDWVVVNEPMDDENPSQLKTGIGKDNIPNSEFYWQDYLGENYARTAVEFARKHGAAGLKLFVSDYGLVNTAKCQGLIQMIAKWEADGKTKIDGIDAQTSLTCSLDATTQKTYEDQVVEMFNALKGTGKLIKISALDMRMTDANGSLINTSNITRAQQLALAKYYNFVVRKYFEIIPAAQRYGINIGNPIESASNAGLWDSNYNRKFTFSGFADGLAGQAASAE